MAIGAGGIVRAAFLGLALGAVPAAAQTSAGGTWTDPPVRAMAPTPPAPATSQTTPPEKVDAGATSEGKGVETARERASAQVAPPTRETKRIRSSDIPSVRRAHVIAHSPNSGREVGRVRARVVAPALHVRPRLAERPAARPVRRIVARAPAPRYVEVRPYDFRPMPVGRVEGAIHGERNPIFDDGYDRTQRIAAAQAAGYLVVRSRTLRFPDGRMMRIDRPYEDDLD